jgi:DMSO/TMAO reductase YedYZ molybdopterin-dependent catalytic subunit
MGALTGALLTAPLLVALQLGRQLAGLAFPPFDLFDWTARRLPGPLITFGIDSMVTAIRALRLGEISDAAKIAEQTLAVANSLLIGAGAGAVLFGLLRWRPIASSARRPGGALGALVGCVLAAISWSSQAATASPLASTAWILLAYAAWGDLLGRVRDRLPGRLPAAERLAASAEAIDRRRFVVRLGGATALITVAGAGVSAWLATVLDAGREGAGPTWSSTHPLPNAAANIAPVPGTRPEFTPVADHYRIDINTSPPVVRGETWRLRVDGLVEQPRAWSLAELEAGFEPLHQFVTLACISNPIGGTLTSTQRWTGVPLQRLLQEVRPQPLVSHLRIRSIDDFHEVIPIADVLADARIMLTYRWDGLPLPIGHGFPLRLYRPDRYGMKQPKWIQSIEAIAQDEPGYWVTRGWDREARMKATSVIDTVGVDMMLPAANQTTRIPIGGIAHAGARGIGRVEVRVDDGEWQAAALREPLSDRTWVLWRFEWPFQAGDHTFTVRCVERDGTPQIAERSPVRPSGATGLDRNDVML